jgi:hypothetical protein
MLCLWPNDVPCCLRPRAIASSPDSAVCPSSRTAIQSQSEAPGSWPWPEAMASPVMTPPIWSWPSGLVLRSPASIASSTGRPLPLVSLCLRIRSPAWGIDLEEAGGHRFKPKPQRAQGVIAVLHQHQLRLPPACWCRRSRTPHGAVSRSHAGRSASSPGPAGRAARVHRPAATPRRASSGR